MVSTLSPEPHQMFKKNCVFSLKMNLFVRKIWELQIVCGAEISSKFLWLQHLNHNAHRSISYSLEPCTSAQLGDDGKLYHLVEKVLQLGKYETGDVLLVTIFSDK